MPLKWCLWTAKKVAASYESLQTPYHRRAGKSIPTEGAGIQRAEDRGGVGAVSLNGQPRTGTEQVQPPSVQPQCSTAALCPAAKAVRQEANPG